jgi:hypothetical protein
MADELAHLKGQLSNIATVLTSLPTNISLRYGFVVFRDQGKSGSVQLFELTDNWDLFAENLMAVTAVGGGDYPENLNGGLYQAITDMNWEPQASRLLIILGDAPPHFDIDEPMPFDETMLMAVEQNITVFTVGSDGLNETGIEIYQQIAEIGNGRFMFVSNSPESTTLVNAPAVQQMTNLTNVLEEIVLEVLRDQK